MTRNLIHEARLFAYEAHEGQERDGGEPYITHPEQVATILETLTDNQDLIAAAWLHDTVEDCGVTPEQLEDTFNPTVAQLVMEVTCVRHEEKGKIFPNLKTREGIMLKLADRLSNIADMRDWTDEQKQVYLEKTKFWKDGTE